MKKEKEVRVLDLPLLVNCSYDITAKQLKALFKRMPHLHSKGSYVKFRKWHRKFKVGKVQELGYTMQGGLGRSKLGGAIVFCYKVNNEWYYEFEIKSYKFSAI